MKAERPGSETDLRILREGAGLPISVEALGPLSTGLAIIYALLIPLHLQLLDGHARLVMVLAEALLLLVFLSQRLWLARRPISRRPMKLLSLGTVSLPYLSVLLLLALDPDPFHTSFVLVILIGCGAFYLSAAWLSVSMAALAASWLAAIHLVVPTVDSLQLLALLLVAATLASAIFVSRRRNRKSLQSALDLAAQEIGQRKVTEDTLRKSEHRLELAITGSHGGWWDVALDPSKPGELPDNVYLSSALKQLIGFNADEFPDSLAAWRDRIVAEDREEVEQSARQHLAGQRAAHRAEYRIRHKSGDIRWMETLGRIEHDDNGRPVRFAGVDRDITARVEQERALSLLSRAVEQSSSIVLITDPAGGIIYVNPKFTEVTGYEADEVQGRNPRILSSGETPPEVYADLWDTIKSGGEWHGELKNKTRLGEPFWVLASISPVTDDAGRVINYLGVQENITERKRAEEHLVKSQRLEAIGQLVSGVAHDFNNLLTSILGFSEMVAASLPPENSEGRHQIGQVIQAGESAAALTRQLLAVGRQQLLRPTLLDPNEELTRIEDLLRRTLGEDVELNMDLDPNVGRIRADASQLQQVVLNLAVNARDAMPGGGTLSFETANVELDESYVQRHPGAAAGTFVMIAISDSGCGMDRDTLQRIFEPFFTTKKQGHGTGLGLATTYGIVKQSGGYIWAYSEPDKGTSFKIYLPRLAETGEPVLEAAAITLRGGNETILVVEDEKRVRALLTEFLRGEGYNILECADADQALEIAARHAGEIDLLITDLVLPGANGDELAEHLHSREPSLRMLLITGWAKTALQRKRALDPELPLLTKPFTMRDLGNKVRQILDGEPQAIFGGTGDSP